MFLNFSFNCDCKVAEKVTILCSKNVSDAELHVKASRYDASSAIYNILLDETIKDYKCKSRLRSVSNCVQDQRLSDSTKPPMKPKICKGGNRDVLSDVYKQECKLTKVDEGQHFKNQGIFKAIDKDHHIYYY